MRKLSVGLGVIAMGALGMSLQAMAADIVVTIDGGVRTSASEGQCLAAVPAFTNNDCSYNDDGSVIGGVANWIGPGLTGAFYDLNGAPPALWTTFPNPDTDGREGIPLSGTITIDNKDAPAACSTHELSGSIVMAAFDRHYQTQTSSHYIDRFPNGITQTIAKKQVDGGTPNGAGGCDYVLGSAGAPNIITGPGSDPFPGRIPYVTTAVGGAGTTQWTAPGTAGLATFESNTGFAATASVGAGYSCTRSTGDCTTTGFSTVSWNDNDKASWKNIVGTLSTDSSGGITSSTLFLVHELPVVGFPSWLAYTVSLTGASPNGNAVDDTATTPQDAAVSIDVLDNDTSFSDPVTVTIATNPANGGAVVSNSPGNQAAVRITYTPNAGFFGEDSFTYTVDDGVYTDTATVTVTVFEVGANEDTASTRRNAPVLIDVLANDSGFDDPVTLSLVVLPGLGTADVVDTDGDPVPGGTGNLADLRIRYTPDVGLTEGETGQQDIFTYQVSSTAGAGEPTQAGQPWVGSNNSNGGLYGQGDGVLSVTNILAPLSAEAQLTTAAGAFTQLVLTINGSWESRILSPFAPPTATNIFTYTDAEYTLSAANANVTDSGDCGSFGGTAGNSCLVVVYSTNPSGNPVDPGTGLPTGAEPDDRSYDLDFGTGVNLSDVENYTSPRSIPLTGGSVICLDKNGTSCGSGNTWQTNGFGHIYLKTVIDLDAGGVAVGLGTVRLGWKSDSGGTGYGLEIVESSGSTLTDTAEVTVDIENQLPVATAGAISISTAGADPNDTSGSVNVTTITGNSVGDTPAVVTVSGVSNGTATVSGTTITFEPAAGFFAGTTTFQYSIADEDGEEDGSDVTVTIADVAPTLANGAGAGNQDALVNASAAFIAGNGTVAQHTLAVQTQALNGSCAAAVSGSNVVVTYTPNSGYTGPDSCVVRLRDGDGDPDDGTFTYTINATGGGGSGISLPGGSSAIDPWSLLLLGGLPLLRRRRN
jgi:hypothetical protein